MTDDTRLRIKCAALSFANDHGPLPAANRGDDAAQEALADRLVSMLRHSGLRIERIRPVNSQNKERDGG